METILKATTTLLPYHLLSYGTLLGTELYQTFINTKIAYRSLTSLEFLALQKRLFPIYFGCQVGLAALTAATHPPYGILSLTGDIWAAAPLVAVAVIGALNWGVFGPRTVRASLVRWVLKDNRVADDGKVQRANRDFAKNHAMSIHLNAIALVATVWYGFSLSSRLSLA